MAATGADARSACARSSAGPAPSRVSVSIAWSSSSAASGARPRSMSEAAWSARLRAQVRRPLPRRLLAQGAREPRRLVETIELDRRLDGVRPDRPQHFGEPQAERRLGDVAQPLEARPGLAAGDRDRTDGGRV